MPFRRALTLRRFMPKHQCLIIGLISMCFCHYNANCAYSVLQSCKNIYVKLTATADQAVHSVLGEEHKCGTTDGAVSSKQGCTSGRGNGSGDQHDAYSLPNSCHAAQRLATQVVPQPVSIWVCLYSTASSRCSTMLSLLVGSYHTDVTCFDCSPAEVLSWLLRTATCLHS